MSKYNALSSHLAAQGDKKIVLKFSEIETLLGFSLPRSAFKYPAWWANQSGDGHSQSAAWQSAGWHTCGLDLDAKHVRFSRDGADVSPETLPLPRKSQTTLTIEQARSGLAAYFGVKPENVEITIRG